VRGWKIYIPSKEEFEITAHAHFFKDKYDRGELEYANAIDNTTLPNNSLFKGSEYKYFSQKWE